MSGQSPDRNSRMKFIQRIVLVVVGFGSPSFTWGTTPRCASPFRKAAPLTARRRAALLRRRAEERQIRSLFSRSPKTDLCELPVSPYGMQPLLVRPKAYPPTHCDVRAERAQHGVDGPGRRVGGFAFFYIFLGGFFMNYLCLRL